jgi:hypothetical protein
MPFFQELDIDENRRSFMVHKQNQENYEKRKQKEQMKLKKL